MKNNNNILFKDLSYKIIGIAFKIHRLLGPGLPEHCHEHALSIELFNLNIPTTFQQHHELFYNNDYVGHFFTDIIVDNKIILELKSDNSITSSHISQLITYLKATRLKVGYVVNFGSLHLQFKRVIL